MTTAFKERNLLAVIGDEVRKMWLICSIYFTDSYFVKDTITGLLLAGIGHVERGKKNFLVVDTSECCSYMEDVTCFNVAQRHKCRLSRLPSKSSLNGKTSLFSS